MTSQVVVELSMSLSESVELESIAFRVLIRSASGAEQVGCEIFGPRALTDYLSTNCKVIDLRKIVYIFDSIYLINS